MGADVCIARERAGHDRDSAIPQMRAAMDDLFQADCHFYGILTTSFLVETLMERGLDGDVAEAEVAIERLAAVRADEGLVIRDIWLLRLRALLARAHGDDARYRDFRDRYRETARTLAFEGHIAWAQAMPGRRQA